MGVHLRGAVRARVRVCVALRDCFGDCLPSTVYFLSVSRSFSGCRSVLIGLVCGERRGGSIDHGEYSVARLTCRTRNRSFFYFALLIVLGNWMLFNLFVAILLTKFFEQKNLVCACVCPSVRREYRRHCM